MYDVPFKVTTSWGAGLWEATMRRPPTIVNGQPLVALPNERTARGVPINWRGQQDAHGTFEDQPEEDFRP